MTDRPSTQNDADIGADIAFTRKLVYDSVIGQTQTLENNTAARRRTETGR